MENPHEITVGDMVHLYGYGSCCEDIDGKVGEVLRFSRNGRGEDYVVVKVTETRRHVCVSKRQCEPFWRAP